MVEVEAWSLKVFPILRSCLCDRLMMHVYVYNVRGNSWPFYEIIISITRIRTRLFLFLSFEFDSRFFFFFNLISFKEYCLLDTKCGRKLVLQPQFTALDDDHKRNNCVYCYSPKVCPSPAEPQMEPIPPPKPRLKRALLAPFQRDYVSDLVKA